MSENSPKFEYKVDDRSEPSDRQKLVLAGLVGAIGGAGMMLASKILADSIFDESTPTPIVWQSPETDATATAIRATADASIRDSQNTLATAESIFATARAVLTGTPTPAEAATKTPTMSPTEIAKVEAIGAQIAATERARTITLTPTPESTATRARPTATPEATSTSSFDVERLCNDLKDVVVTDVETLPTADPCPNREGSYVVSINNQNRTFKDWLNAWGARAYMWLQGDRNPGTQDASMWIQTQESASSNGDQQLQPQPTSTPGWDMATVTPSPTVGFEMATVTPSP